MPENGPSGKRAATLLVAALIFYSPVQPLSSFGPGKTTTPLEHVIIIMQENHSFDNYFGTYPTANGSLVDNITSRLSAVNGIPDGVCQQYQGSCISPHLTTSLHPDNPVEGQSVYENDYVPGVGFPQSSGPQSMVYFDYRTIPAYWDYAEEYGIADNYYAAVLGMTTPNRMMLLTGDAPTSGNYGPPPYISYNSTILNQLSSAGVSWGYYDFIGAGADPSSVYPLNYITGIAASQNNVRDLSSLFAALASNSGLPDVCFVNFLGSSGLDEHPPSSPSAGELQTVAVVNAVMESEYWNSTAIFLTYDEGGGFYDHVTPPSSFSVDHNFTSPLQGPGQRVPLLVISPYSKLNYVSHTVMNHLSLLHFVEYNWGIAPLNSLIGSASVPVDFFDFAQAPRPPIILGGGSGSDITYPLALQSSSEMKVGASNSAPGPELILVSLATTAVAISVAVLFLTTRRGHHQA